MIVKDKNKITVENEVQNIIADLKSSNEFLAQEIPSNIKILELLDSTKKLTAHYKFDYKKILLASAKDQNQDQMNNPQEFSVIEPIFRECIGPEKFKEFDFEKTLVENGVDSLDLINIESRIETVCERKFETLLLDLLNLSIGKIINKYQFLQAGRGNAIIDNICFDTVPDAKKPKIDEGYQRDQKDITQIFSHNLHGCIDAECLLTETAIYVGSHAGVLTALCPLENKIYWQISLPGPIVSKPIIFSNKILIIALREGQIFKIEKESGKILAKFDELSVSGQSGHQQCYKTIYVKNGHCIDEKKGKLLAGSYFDGHTIVVLDLNEDRNFGVILQKINVEFSIRNRPILMNSENKMLFTGINGKFAVLALENYEIEHQIDMKWASPSPFFAPTISLPSKASEPDQKLFLAINITAMLHIFDDVLRSRCKMQLNDVKGQIIARPNVMADEPDIIYILSSFGQILMFSISRLSLIRKLDFTSSVSAAQLGNSQFLSFKLFSPQKILLHSTKCIFIADENLTSNSKILIKSEKPQMFSPVEVLTVEKYENKNFIRVYFGSRNDYFTCLRVKI